MSTKRTTFLVPGRLSHIYIINKHAKSKNFCEIQWTDSGKHITEINLLIETKSFMNLKIFTFYLSLPRT